MTEENKQEISPYFGAFILETLTVGMYGESRNAIREYVQNAFDSIRKAIDRGILAPGEGRIKVIMRPDSLTIRDNGMGLPTSSATKTLISIGASGKSYKNAAGFRGIGRLAGIVFSDVITFVTKAKGETEQTTVVFDAHKMRRAMKPDRANDLSAEQLLQENVRAFTSVAADPGDHFLEVRLTGWTDAPAECTSAPQLRSFLSQVAPVPYAADFPLREKLMGVAKETGIAIEEVAISLQEPGGDSEEITKPYRAKHRMDASLVDMTDCLIRKSPDDGKRWWAWVGLKKESGAYTDSEVRGLRIRVRNIQIDGTEIVQGIFRQIAASYARFQDFYVGEIFVEPSLLVPNARRDGFEENPDWKNVREELRIQVITELSKLPYEESNQGAYSLKAQQRNRAKAKKAFAGLQKTEFADQDKAIELSRNITNYQKKIAKSSQNADLETMAQLQAIASELTDIKREVLEKIGTGATQFDREQVENEVRQQLLKEILSTLEDGLGPQCRAEVRRIFEKRF